MSRTDRQGIPSFSILLLLPLILLLGGCSRSPSFEERKEEGIAAFREGRYEEAVRTLDALARENSRDFDVRYYLARSHEEDGAYPVALREWEDVLVLKPSFVEGHYRKGNCLILLGKREEAIAEWKHVVRLDPTYHKAYYNMARAYEDGENWDEAIRYYIQTIEIDSTFLLGYLNFGLLLQRAQQNDYALHMFDRAIEIDPDFAPPYMNRINILLALDRKEEAAGRIRELLEIESLDPAVRDSLSLLLSGIE